MTKEKNETSNATPFENYTDNNGNLKRYLNLALKNTRDILKTLLPKISNEVKNMINFHLEKTKGQVQTNNSKNAINEKAIREHLYSIVGYNRKEEENGAFEIVVYRAIKLGRMMVDYPNEFSVDTKENKIYVMDKIATPQIVVKKQGQKSNTEKVQNTSEKLVQVNTGTIDRVFRVKYGGGSSKGSKTKDAQGIANNFKSISKAFLNGLDKLLSLSSKKKVEFFDLVDEEVHDNLSNILTLMNSDAYTDMRNFSVDYEVSINGKDVVKKDNNKKIA